MVSWKAICHRMQQDFILKDDNCYYLFCFDLPIKADVNVGIAENAELEDRFELTDRITAVTWMDNGDALSFTQEKDKVTVYTQSQGYGRNLVVRVAKIQCE